MGEGRSGWGFIRGHSSQDTTPDRIREEAGARFPCVRNRQSAQAESGSYLRYHWPRIYKEGKIRENIRVFRVMDLNICRIRIIKIVKNM